MHINENGLKWARLGLVAGVAASITGNVANAWLTSSPVSLGLRVPMAIIWPVFLFLAVEILVRNRAISGFLMRIGQGALLAVAIPTAITSFVNLYDLMVKSGEPATARITGPICIDLFMLGCTVVMLAARSTPATSATLDPVAIIGKHFEIRHEPAAVAPVVRVRATNADAQSKAEKGVLALIEGQTPEDAAKLVDAGVSTVRRWARAIKLVRAGEEIDLKKEHVTAELVAFIKEQVAQ